MRRLHPKLRARVVGLCPFPGCKEAGAPLCCAGCWAKVPGDVRRELLAELGALKARGQRKPSRRLLELFHEAFRSAAPELEAAG